MTMVSEAGRLTERRWIVLLAHAREEVRAAAMLTAHRIDVYLPQIMERKCCGRKMRERPAPMLPTYLFLPASPHVPWGRIRATPGIRVEEGKLPALMINGQLALVPDAAMQIVMAKESKLFNGHDKPPGALDVGQEVEIIDGPFRWLKGVIDNIDALDTKGRLSVAMDIFGRLTPSQFEVSQVRAV